MINLRYHVVTLVAVFLALGLGVLFGASFIDQNTVKALETAQDRLSARNDRLVDRVRALEDDRDALERFTESAAGYLVSGRLKGKPVLVLSFESTPKSAIESTVGALVQAGANIDGSIQMSTNLDMSNETRREQVAIAIGAEAGNADALAKSLIEEMSAALAGKKPGTLKRLVDSGLASTRNVANVEQRDPTTIPSAGTIIVLVAGEETSGPLLERLAVPLLGGLAGQNVTVAVAGEGDVVEDGLIDRTRSERGLRVVSVDGIDGALGQTALALGLEAALTGRFGHYGTGDGADAPIPELAPRN